MRAMVSVGKGSSNMPALLENTPAGGRLGGPEEVEVAFSDSVAAPNAAPLPVPGSDADADAGTDAGTDADAGTGTDTDTDAGCNVSPGAGLGMMPVFLILFACRLARRRRLPV